MFRAATHHMKLFVTEYFLSRSIRALVAGLPTAVLLVLMILYFRGAEKAYSGKLATTYRQAFDQAARQDDHEQMLMLSRTLIDLQPHDSESKFLMAKALEEAGETEQAHKMLKQLAPANDSGYKAAHTWLATRLLESLDDNVEIPDVLRLIHHLKHSDRADDPYLKYRLGTFYLSLNETALATTYLQDAHLPDADLLLARIAQSQKNETQHERYLQQAKIAFRSHCQENPQNLQARIGWIECCLLEGELQNAIQLIAETQAENPAVKERLAELCVEASQRLRTSQPFNTEGIAKLATMAFTQSPDTALTQAWITKLLESGFRFPDALLTQLEDTLQHASSEEDATSPDQMRLAQFLVASGKNEPGIKVLNELVDEMPHLHLTLARIYHNQDNHSSAKKHAHQAAEYYQSQIKNSDDDRAEWHILYSQSLCLMESWEKARKYFKDLGSESSYQNAIASTWLLQADAVASEASAWKQRHELLWKAHESAPRSIAPVKRFLQDLQIEGECRKSARDYLYKFLAKGLSYDYLHLMLGTDALAHEDWKTGVQHLQQALRNRPRDPMLLNNLAFAMLRDPNGDQEKALQYANTAAEIVPKHPEIMATRGRIHFALKNYEECIADLELALGKTAETPELHQILANAYSETGNERAARQHGELAEADGP